MKTFLFGWLTILASAAFKLGAAQGGDPLSEWHELATDAVLHDVTAADFAQGRWVAVTAGGHILSSPDGKNWIKADFQSSAGMRAVQFGGSHWVALAGDGKVLTSADGLVWTPAAWGPVMNQLSRLTFGNGRWLAVGRDVSTGSDAWLWSSDEVNWQSAPLMRGASVESLNFGTGEWLATIYYGLELPTRDENTSPLPTLLASPDGEHWTARRLPDAIRYPQWVTYGDDRWVIMATECGSCGADTLREDIVWTSLDGVSWERTGPASNYSPGSPGGVRTAAIWAAGRWHKPIYWLGTSRVSLDARVWTAPNLPTQAIRFGEGKWLGLDAVDWDGYRNLSASPNGRQWTIARTYSPGERVAALESADGLWALGGTLQGTNIFILTSTDGQLWTPANIPAGAFGGMSKLRHTSEGWVALVQPDWPASSRLLRSLDGRNWTWADLGRMPGSQLLDLTYANGKWLGTSGPGDRCAYLVASTNLTDWQAWPQTGGQDLVFQRLEFAHGLYFGLVSGACSFDSYPGEAQFRIVSSTDGKNWTDRYVGLGITDVSLVNGRLMALSWSGSSFESDPLLSLQKNRPEDVIIRRASGIPVVLESSDDLSQWHTLTNLPLGSPIEAVTDPEAVNSAARFYRARTP